MDSGSSDKETRSYNKLHVGCAAVFLLTSLLFCWMLGSTILCAAIACGLWIDWKLKPSVESMVLTKLMATYRWEHRITFLPHRT